MTDQLKKLLNIYTDEKAETAKKKIKNVYLKYNLPWIVGYSGGKDSTLVVQLILETLLEMKKMDINLDKTIYIISSDTLVENPLVSGIITKAHQLIEKTARQHKLPIKTQILNPPINESFWVNLIGRGYPAPNQNFRWCTDRLKILPSNNFITSVVSTHGEVITVLGVREGESASRDRVIQSHQIDGIDLMTHSTLRGAYVFSPIIEFTTDDVWNYLLDHPSPWGGDNYFLYEMYADSSAGECPLIIDKETKEYAGSCGNSRFGCWTCTVVQKDKSLTGFIKSGHEWLKPLLEFRDKLYNTRNYSGYRMYRRLNGQIYFIPVNSDKLNPEYEVIDESMLSSHISSKKINLSSGDELDFYIKKGDQYFVLGPGGYTLEARQKILKELLNVEKKLNWPKDLHPKPLITLKELKEIRRLWIKNGDIEDSLPKIYREAYPDREIDWDQDDFLQLSYEQYMDLEQFSNIEDINFEMIKELIQVEKKYLGLKSRNGIMSDIRKVLNKDYFHIDKEFSNEN